MKVLIINPNSDSKMTDNIRQLVSHFPLEYITPTVLGMENTPAFVDSQPTIDATFAEVAQTILSRENEFDIFILACHLDPNLEKLRALTKKMVLGIGQCSLLYATLWHGRYSIIGSSSKTVGLKEEMARRYHAAEELDTVGYPKAEDNAHFPDNLLHAAQDALRQYDSPSIVLGCAGFTGVDAYLEEKLNRPVIDGILTALMAADSYAKYNHLKKEMKNIL